MEELSESNQIALEEEQWANLLDEVDKNRDGKICFEEFEAMMTDIIFREEVKELKKKTREAITDIF